MTNPNRSDRLFPAMNPKTRKADLFAKLSPARVEQAIRNPISLGKDLMLILRDVLRDPFSISCGIREQDENTTRFGGCGRWCYCGNPGRDRIVDGHKRANDDKEVFLVFMDEELFAYAWGWERIDPDDRNFPAGYLTRFREWPYVRDQGRIRG